mgnify:FL=1
MNEQSFRALACRPWSGFWKPYRSADGLLKVHQHDAAAILRSGMGLSEWEGRLLNAVHNTPGELSPAQSHYLGKLCDRYETHVLGVAA